MEEEEDVDQESERVLEHDEAGADGEKDVGVEVADVVPDFGASFAEDCFEEDEIGAGGQEYHSQGHLHRFIPSRKLVAELVVSVFSCLPVVLENHRRHERKKLTK